MRCLPLRAILSFFMLPASLLFSQEIFLAGEQDGYYERGSYLVWKDIVVDEGKTLTFAPGCIVRFKPLTGITVEGTLKCLGNPAHPIVLTSESDRFDDGDDTRRPRPFDWNGVQAVDDSATIIFGHVRVLYSTYGINVADEQSLGLLDSVVFADNGRQNLAIDGQPLAVEDAVPFSWGESVREAASREVSLSPAVPEPSDVVSPPSRKRRRLPMRLIVGGVAVAGGTLATVAHLRSQEMYRQYRSISGVPGETPAIRREKQARLERLEEQALRFRRTGNVGIAIAAIGAVGFAVTFFF
jgi:hypothetical protein